MEGRSLVPFMNTDLENASTQKTFPGFQAWWSDWRASRQLDEPQNRYELPENGRGKRMRPASTQHIPLSSAYLCQDCNCIGNCASQCPACASEVLLSLAGVLNRESEEEMGLNLVEMAIAAA